MSVDWIYAGEGGTHMIILYMKNLMMSKNTIFLGLIIQMQELGISIKSKII